MSLPLHLKLIFQSILHLWFLRVLRALDFDILHILAFYTTGHSSFGSYYTNPSLPIMFRGTFWRGSPFCMTIVQSLNLIHQLLFSCTRRSCVCVCVHAFVGACMHVWCVCIYDCVCMCACVCMQACGYVWMCVSGTYLCSRLVFSSFL